MPVELERFAADSGGSLTVRGSQGQPTTYGHVAWCRQSRAPIAQLLGKLGFNATAEGDRHVLVGHHRRRGRPARRARPTPWQF